VQLAVWFHDAVYDPRSKDNEERSAGLVGEWLGPLGLPPETLAKVAALVRATAHFSGGAASDPDAVALLDADLAILGASEARYRRYAADVRREFAFVPDDAYRTGRAAVLESFLRRDRIYRTDAMHAEGDGPARRNLAAELAELR
jgi:predicted metal-dependent HD superfamily phosphohydrolase